jgi:exopolyphosphatase/guanosine-5'-triphosphate,3'-diphosphate pyrophosphatase
MKAATHGTPLAAIDVGSNAVRLEIARGYADGSMDLLHQERDPVRPGEGSFQTGSIPAPVVTRLLAVLRRYAILCKRHHARVRAVGTSALREAKNREAIIARIKKETGIVLEAVSGKEEARLMCLGILLGRPPSSRSLCLDIGGGSTEVAGAEGEIPTKLWSVAIGTVRLTEIFRGQGEITAKQLKLMRGFAREAIEDNLPHGIPGFPRTAFGSSGSIRAIVASATGNTSSTATAAQLSRVVDRLAELGVAGRLKLFDPRRADVIVAGAIILEALVAHLKLQKVTAVDRGLRDGVLVDLLRRKYEDDTPTSLLETACVLGRRFQFDEPHARQVTRLALAIFDGMAPVHRLPHLARVYLEAAAALHDIGHAVSYQKHHRHSEYLIRNGDIPGLADQERDLVARIARYHRRSPPDLGHPGMNGLAVGEARMVRKLATILRVADALDRSHAQPITTLRATRLGSAIQLRLGAKGPADLELWDAGREVALFRKVFGLGLHLRLGAGAGPRGQSR